MADPSQFGSAEMSVDPSRVNNAEDGHPSMLPLEEDGNQNVFGYDQGRPEGSTSSSEGLATMPSSSQPGHPHQIGAATDASSSRFTSPSNTGIANGTEQPLAPNMDGTDGAHSVSSTGDGGSATATTSVVMGRMDSSQGGPPATASTVVGSDEGDSKEPSPRKTAEPEFNSNAAPSKPGDAKVAVVLAVNAELFR